MKASRNAVIYNCTYFQSQKTKWPSTTIHCKKESLIYTRNSLFVSQSIKDIKSSGSAISRYFLLKIYRTEMGINLRRRPNSWRFAMRYYDVITDCVWDQWAATSLQFQMDGVVHMDFLSTIFVKIHWKTNSQIQFCKLVFKKKKKKTKNFFYLFAMSTTVV